MIVLVTVAGCLLLTGMALYFYWLYAPLPQEPSLASKISRERMTFGGYERTYWSYVPPRLIHESKMPLLIVLHGSGLLAGIATVAANLPTPDNRLIEPHGAMLPILMVNGTKDPIIPYDGGKVNFFGKKMGNVVSALSTIAAFIENRQNVDVAEPQ